MQGQTQARAVSDADVQGRHWGATPPSKPDMPADVGVAMRMDMRIDVRVDMCAGTPPWGMRRGTAHEPCMRAGQAVGDADVEPI